MTASHAIQTAAPQPATPHLATVPAPFMLIAPERLWELYAAMLRCRAIAERAGELARASVPARPLYGARGREAMYAGVLVGLQRSDVLLPAPEDRLAGFLHGQSLGDLFAPLAPSKANRRRRSSVAQKAGVLPLAPTPDAQLHMANGAALALKPQKDHPLVVALCGAHAPSDEAWKQALEFAGAHLLPVLFVCHSGARNAAGKAANEERFDQLEALAQVAGVPAIAVDAQDVVAVYRVASESIARARLRRGPTLIACLAHPTSQESNKNRHAGLPASSGKAIQGMENYLGRKALFDPTRKAQIVDAIVRQLDRATRGLLR